MKQEPAAKTPVPNTTRSSHLFVIYLAISNATGNCTININNPLANVNKNFLKLPFISLRVLYVINQEFSNISINTNPSNTPTIPQGFIKINARIKPIKAEITLITASSVYLFIAT